VKRGDLYRVYRGLRYDPKDYRVCLVVSRQGLIDATFFCDELVSLPKSKLTDYIGALSADKMQAVNAALRIALATG
jgi:mRNA interferase MazF